MTHFFYKVILIFILGGVLIALTNRNKPNEVQKNNWIKFVTYLIIVNLVFGIII